MIDEKEMLTTAQKLQVVCQTALRISCQKPSVKHAFFGMHIGLLLVFDCVEVIFFIQQPLHYRFGSVLPAVNFHMCYVLKEILLDTRDLVFIHELFS